MPHIPLEEILEVNHNLRRYRFHLKMEPGLRLAAELNFNDGSQFVRLGLTGKPFPLAEIYWEEGEGIAHLMRSDGWVRLRGEPFADEVGRLVSLLGETRPPEVVEEGPFWVLEYHPEHLPLRARPRAFFHEIFGEPRDEHMERVMSRMVEQARSIEAVQRVRIFRETLQVQGIQVETWWHGGRRSAQAEFLPAEEPIQGVPQNIRGLDLPEISLGMLVFYLDNIGGWSSKGTHGPWTQRAINLIKDVESELDPLDRVYSELYEHGWGGKPYTETDGRSGLDPKLGTHHPMVVGAIREDDTGSLKKVYDIRFSGDKNFQADPAFYYSGGDYKRYYHHYGGDGVGLKDKWYFVFHGPPNTTQGDRFYSARDWGFGYGRINEALNRLTFTRAVEQYHQYTKQGKFRAYLMLGHVLHLLEDVGQPDHAKLEDHAASSMDEVDAYKTFGYCHFLAVEAALVTAKACGPFALVCGVGAFGIAEAACWASASKDVVGYEKLIGDHWKISRVNEAIQSSGIIHRDNYDTYFHDLAHFGMNKVSQLGLSYALGCGTLMLIPPVPNADPNIDSSDENEVQPFYALTDGIVPQIIGMTAGFMEYFYDIVNYPPFLERVQIVQFEPNAKPVRFGVLKENTPLHCQRYDAEWVSSGSATRSFVVHKNQPLALDHPAYVFLLFGPSKVFPERAKMMKEVFLRLKGIMPATGETIDSEVRMEQGMDGKLGPFYWGTFMPINCGADPYTLFMEVSGKDKGPHDDNRAISGEEVDGDPSKKAVVDFKLADFPWKDYAPGVDAFHKVTIPVPFWNLEIQPKSPFVLSTQVRRDSHETILRIRQTSWDCNWEPYEGIPTCPTEWKVAPDVLWHSPGGRQQTAPWRSFNFEVALDTDLRTHSAVVRVSVHPNSVKGQYDLEVQYRYGTFERTVIIQFEIQ